MSHDDRDTIRVQSPEPPAELMVELEGHARELLAAGENPAWAALTVCLRAGLDHPMHIAIDMAERIRRAK